MDNLQQHINNLAKAELHIHLEGSLEPEMMLQLAKRNQITLPYQSVAEIAQLYRFNKLQEFLDIYYQGMSVLLQEEDFFDLTYAYLQKAHADNVTYTEMFLDPQAHTERGIAFVTVINGVSRAINYAKDELGIEASLILCFLRHLPEKHALKTFEIAMQYRDKFIGIGLDSSEIGHPPQKFKHLFELARKENLLLVAHAGEEGSAQNVWDTIDILGVSRIDHGNAIQKDATLIKRIAKDKIPLTMCPLSNQCLKVVPDLAYHPAMNFLEQGICVTINSDDPAYFGGYINQNYTTLAQALNLRIADLTTLANNSFTSCLKLHGTNL